MENELIFAKWFSQTPTPNARIENACGFAGLLQEHIGELKHSPPLVPTDLDIPLKSGWLLAVSVKGAFRLGLSLVLSLIAKRCSSIASLCHISWLLQPSCFSECTCFQQIAAPVHVINGQCNFSRQKILLSSTSQGGSDNYGFYLEGSFYPESWLRICFAGGCRKMEGSANAFVTYLGHRGKGDPLINALS